MLAPQLAYPSGFFATADGEEGEDAAAPPRPLSSRDLRYSRYSHHATASSLGGRGSHLLVMDDSRTPSLCSPDVGAASPSICSPDVGSPGARSLLLEAGMPGISEGSQSAPEGSETAPSSPHVWAHTVPPEGSDAPPLGLPGDAEARG